MIDPVLCSVTGCGRSARTRGWCQKHYLRWYKRGNVDDPYSPSRRFWAKVDKNGPAPAYRPDLGPCWLWTASTWEGYGHFSLTKTTSIRAHKWAYQQAIGPVPSGLQLDHLCRVTTCVNPGHLEAVTPRENTLRSEGITARLARATECRRGHPKTPGNVRIRRDGSRLCRICNRDRRRKYDRLARAHATTEEAADG